MAKLRIRDCYLENYDYVRVLEKESYEFYVVFRILSELKENEHGEIILM